MCWQLNDMGHYAEALMTKGVLAPRGSMEQLKVGRCLASHLPQDGQRGLFGAFWVIV